jgi:hypothetical protein
MKKTKFEFELTEKEAKILLHVLEKIVSGQKTAKSKVERTLYCKLCGTKARHIPSTSEYLCPNVKCANIDGVPDENLFVTKEKYYEILDKENGKF